MIEHDAFAERERALEDEYFRKKDLELIERMHKAALTAKARAEIERSTGLSDPALLQELLELGFTPKTVSLLPLVPVLEVAWAEGGISPAERELIEKIAHSRGIDDESPAGDQLRQWMTTRPDDTVFQRAGRLIAAMLGSSSHKVFGLTAEELVAYCERSPTRRAASSGPVCAA